MKYLNPYKIFEAIGAAPGNDKLLETIKSDITNISDYLLDINDFGATSKIDINCWKVTGNGSIDLTNFHNITLDTIDGGTLDDTIKLNTISERLKDGYEGLSYMVNISYPFNRSNKLAYVYNQEKDDNDYLGKVVPQDILDTSKIINEISSLVSMLNSEGFETYMDISQDFIGDMITRILVVKLNNK